MFCVEGPLTSAHEIFIAGFIPRLDLRQLRKRTREREREKKRGGREKATSACHVRSTSEVGFAKKPVGIQICLTKALLGAEPASNLSTLVEMSPQKNCLWRQTVANEKPS